MALTHSDIGGYTTLNVDQITINIANRTQRVRIPPLEKRICFVRDDKELYRRWMEVASVTSTALFRTHEGSVPDANMQLWQDYGTDIVLDYFLLVGRVEPIVCRVV